jgi:hypothetical protein
MRIRDGFGDRTAHASGGRDLADPLAGEAAHFEHSGLWSQDVRLLEDQSVVQRRGFRTAHPHGSG